MTECLADAVIQFQGMVYKYFTFINVSSAGTLGCCFVAWIWVAVLMVK